jgi:acyl carrier protein
MEIPSRLRDYIDENRGSLPPIVDPDEPLQLDSLGTVRLVALLESEFGYQIEDRELIAENFSTLRRLGELLATKRRGGKPRDHTKRVLAHFRRTAKRESSAEIRMIR